MVKMETTCIQIKIAYFIQDILSLTIGNKYAVNLAKATPTAAIVPVCITAKKLQPYRKPTSFPYASLIYILSTCFWKHRTQLTVTHSSDHRNRPGKNHMAMSHPAEPNYTELTIFPNQSWSLLQAWFHPLIRVLFKFFVIFLHYF
jgi:hypothetical protein